MRETKPSSRDSARFAKLARLAAEAAVSVGGAIAIENTEIVTRKRGRANFATAADHAAERAILSRLSAYDSRIPILAEESVRKGIFDAERLWVVDPLDGTLNFSRGLPFYCVLIGYVEAGKVRSSACAAYGRNLHRLRRRGRDAKRLADPRVTRDAAARCVRCRKPRVRRDEEKGFSLRDAQRYVRAAPRHRISGP
jgi:fructose-1,6-bisphosphatase/inositol monophosphatase family enzyme